MNSQMPRDHDQMTTAPKTKPDLIAAPPKPALNKAEVRATAAGNGDDKLGPGERWMTPAENRAADKAEAKAAKHA
jgi:hypothetical protein